MKFMASVLAIFLSLTATAQNDSLFSQKAKTYGFNPRTLPEIEELAKETEGTHVIIWLILNCQPCINSVKALEALRTGKNIKVTYVVELGEYQLQDWRMRGILKWGVPQNDFVSHNLQSKAKRIVAGIEFSLYPTTFIFKDGALKHHFSGWDSEQKFLNNLTPHL